MHPLTNILHRRLRDAGLLKYVSPPVAEAVFVTHSRLCREGAARLGLRFEAAELAVSFTGLLLKREAELEDLHQYTEREVPEPAV